VRDPTYPQAREREEASMILHEQIEAAVKLEKKFRAGEFLDCEDLTPLIDSFRALLDENKALRDKLAEIDRLETDLEIMSDNYKGALVDLEESKASEKSLREQLQEAEAMEEHERKQAEGMAGKVAELREREKALVEALTACDELFRVLPVHQDIQPLRDRIQGVIADTTPPTAGAGKEGR
jgi:DNA repair exonuclease SbcCD ATPase subunit